jgi:TolA-binding protein
VYVDPRVVQFIGEHFIPVRVHVQQQRDEYKRLAARYNAQWTPTILLLDSAGEERHRIEGFLPADDFLGQLALGAAHAAFARGDFADAERRFRTVVERHAESEMAPEAMYWAGVSRYKGSGDATALSDTARAFQDRYSNSSWAKKASVWAQ